MAHSVDWYIGLMEELDEEFQPVVTMFEYFDKMVRPEWSLPADFTAVVKDVMAVVDTAPSDAINSGAIAFSSNMPIFNVMPQMPNIAEYDRAQNLEDNISYNFKYSNKRGDGSIMYDMSDSSLRYNTICTRVDDLAHILPKNKKKWTSLQKNAWRGGRFIYEAVNPKVARYLHSRMGLTLVGYTESYRVDDIIEYWSLYENNTSTNEGQRIAETLRRLKSDVKDKSNDDSAVLKQMRFSQTYVIDYDRLCIWGDLTDSSGETVSDDEYVFSEQDNPYGFLPWTVRVAGSRIEKEMQYRVNPLLAPLYWSGSWDKLNLAKSVIFSEPFRRARAPRAISITTSGEPLTVDYENGSDIAGRTGDDYKPFQPMSLDQGGVAIVQQLEAALNRTTGASIIGDATQMSSNTPFATFSARIKIALSRLDKQQQILADSCGDIACLMLWWSEKTDVPLMAYTGENQMMRSGNTRPAGQRLEAYGGGQDYSTDFLGISCKVQPKTPTDRMEQLNAAVIMSSKLNMPVAKLLEDMGVENVGMMYELWVREFQKNAELQAQAARIMAQAQAEGQLAAQQAAQAQQQQQQAQAQQGQPLQPGQETQSPLGAGGGVAQSAFGGLGGQEGMNPAMGGMSPAQGAPSMTREAITGQDRLQQQR